MHATLQRPAKQDKQYCEKGKQRLKPKTKWTNFPLMLLRRRQAIAVIEKENKGKKRRLPVLYFKRTSVIQNGKRKMHMKNTEAVSIYPPTYAQYKKKEKKRTHIKHIPTQESNDILGKDRWTHSTAEGRLWMEAQFHPATGTWGTIGSWSDVSSRRFFGPGANKGVRLRPDVERWTLWSMVNGNHAWWINSTDERTIDQKCSHTKRWKGDGWENSTKTQTMRK